MTNKLKINQLNNKNMKTPLLFFFILIASVSFAQVGIGTANPNASAQLEVNSTTKGFLPPRVSLTGTNVAGPISSPATGLMVYNTATAGTSPSNVTPGLYYYDGAKWQRVINQQPDATISFDKATPTTSGVVFTPNVQNSTDYIYISSVDNSNWTYNGSIYVTYTPNPSTAWFRQSTTNVDAGSDKTNGIYRTGNVGIGDFATSSPSTKLEVKSGVSNSSGLKLTNLTSSSPTSGGATLGVDASGIVVTVNGASFSPSFGSAAPSATVEVGAGANKVLASIDFPTTGTYLINYTMRVQPTAPNTTGQYAVGYLSLTNTDSPISGTEILGAYGYIVGTTSDIKVASGGNYSGSHIITVTSIPTSLYFRARAFSGAMSFYDNDAGRTKISYVKVTP